MEPAQAPAPPSRSRPHPTAGTCPWPGSLSSEAGPELWLGEAWGLWKSSKALLQATEALSSPSLFSLFTLGTDSGVESCPPTSSSSPSRPWYLHLPAGFLPPGSFSLATTCSLGSRVWTAQRAVLRVWVWVLPTRGRSEPSVGSGQKVSGVRLLVLFKLQSYL